MIRYKKLLNIFRQTNRHFFYSPALLYEIYAVLNEIHIPGQGQTTQSKYIEVHRSGKDVEWYFRLARRKENQNVDVNYQTMIC